MSQVVEWDGKFVASESTLGRLSVYFYEWGGQQYLNIRYWYYDLRDGQWKPGKKGISIPKSRVQYVLEALRLALAKDAERAQVAEDDGG